MHDIHPKTIEAVPGIIDGLRKRGFTLVTVDQLLSGTCGGQLAGYGTAVPGEVASDPFGVDSFQGQLAATPPAKATVAKPTSTAQKSAGKPAAELVAPKIQPAERAPYSLFGGDN